MVRSKYTTFLFLKVYNMYIYEYKTKVYRPYLPHLTIPYRCQNENERKMKKK